MDSEALAPFAFTSGPQNARIVIVGEAWGQREEELRRPFCGASGQELIRMIREAWDLPIGFTDDIIEGMWPESRLSPESMLSIREGWLREQSILLTNVFPLRPSDTNDIEALCAPKKDVGEDYAFPPYRMGKYFRPEFLPHIDRLRAEITACGPHLVIACGNTALWATLGVTNIGAVRGTVAHGVLCPGVKVLPTYHPAGVLRNWSWRPIVLSDFIKAKREAKHPDIIRPERQVLVSPTLDEIRAWSDNALATGAALAVDIETKAGMITTIGFAVSRSDAISIPFWLPEEASLQSQGFNYWPDPKDEAAAWLLVRELLNSTLTKIFQNGMYDLQYLWKMGFRPRACLEDTMLSHHSLFPEMQKGLGFLGSIYTDESSWKLIRRQAKDETLKRDE